MDTHSPLPSPRLPAASAPLRLVVMGVSGCGKSTLAAALAQGLGLQMTDADALHSPESVAKMRAGVPLQDEDRWPWLQRIGQALSQASGAGAVVACSALRRAYRERIRAAAGGVRFVFLDGPRSVLEQRLRERQHLYMPPSLLQSQLDTLERPGADEPDVLALSLVVPTPEQCLGVHDWLRAASAPGSPWRASP